jgi:glycosyltransferase involved in cell wall biosynthesis
MHYCFVTYGTWENNAGFIRPRHLGAALLDRGVRVTYIVDELPYNRTQLNLHPKAELAFVSNSRGLKQIPARRRVIRDVNPDFIHLLNPHAKSFAALAGMSDMNIVADFDEPPVLHDFGFVRNRIESAMDRWLRRRANVKIACTKYLHERFRERYGIETVYIPHAPYFVEQPQDVVSPFTRPTAVYMGNLYPAWDHDILFDAARLLAQSGQKPPIAILGDGPEMQKYRSFVREHRLDNVQLPGFVSGADLWRHLRFAHVLLFPIRDTVLNRSRCPSKIFAYAQAKRPLITNRVGELPQLLGETPLYVEESPQAFADAIARAMREPARPDVEYNLKHHTWADRAERLLAALPRTST